MSALYALFLRHPFVSTDSRHIRSGSIFFALRGASFDGNLFAVDSLAKGASCAVVDNPDLKMQHPELADRLIVVEDTLTALQELACEHRRALGIPVLAITGSNGKTTTKELVSRVLAEKYRIYATQGNLNNHIGVPLTLLAMTHETEFGIVEMGASACGEIARLCTIARPDYGLLTNVGRAHLEGFGGPEGVRRGKGELFDWLAAEGGRAFVPREEALLAEMAAQRPDLLREYYSVSIADGVEHRLVGEYNRFNIAAAVAVGRYFGIDDVCIRRAVASYVPDNNRSQRTLTTRNTLILDCYNANPSSMRAAVEHFLAEPLAGRTGKILILGDMLELGAWAHDEHAAILRLACSDPTVEVRLVGREFAAAAAALPETPDCLRLFPSCAELIADLTANPPSDTLILMKGSRGIGLERCIDRL